MNNLESFACAENFYSVGERERKREKREARSRLIRSHLSISFLLMAEGRESIEMLMHLEDCQGWEKPREKQKSRSGGEEERN